MSVAFIVRKCLLVEKCITVNEPSVTNYCAKNYKIHDDCLFLHNLGALKLKNIVTLITTQRLRETTPIYIEQQKCYILFACSVMIMIFINLNIFCCFTCLFSIMIFLIGRGVFKCIYSILKCD